MPTIRPVALAVPRRGEDLFVFEFGCRLADPELYHRDVLGAILDDPGPPVLWRALGSFSAERPLFPAGLDRLLRGV